MPRALEEFYAFHLQMWPNFSLDGQGIFVIRDASGQLNLWKDPPKGGCPRQVTFFEERSVMGFLQHPDGRLFLMADFQLNENHQIFVLEPGKGWPRDLTDKPDRWHRFPPHALSPDGRLLAFASNRGQITDQDLYLLELEGYGIRRLVAEGLWLEVGRFSPDGRFLTYAFAYEMDRVGVGLVDLHTGETTHLIEPGEEETYTPGPWLPDGIAFLVYTDAFGEYTELRRFDLKTRELTPLVKEPGDIEAAELAGGKLFYLWNEGGESRLIQLSLRSHRKRTLPLPKGVSLYLRPSGDGRKLLLTLSKPQFPGSVYLLTARRLRRWSGGFLTGLSEEELVEPESVWYPTFDGKKIHAWLHRPKGTGPFPVAIQLHGGPQWQIRPQYDPMAQFLASRGIAVFSPNFRGSTGYGKSFMKLIRRDWGGGELRDIEEGVKWLQKQPWVDSGRIAVYGGSFGGFATLSCLSRLPQYFCCGVDIVGPSNLVTFARSVPPSWRRFMARWVGDPEEDREFLLSRSPITYVDQIRAPLLILQGANDPRVVKNESDQMVEALRKRGVPVEYVVFEDEGHGFVKRSNRMRASRLIAEFLLRHLKGEML